MADLDRRLEAEPPAAVRARVALARTGGGRRSEPGSRDRARRRAGASRSGSRRRRTGPLAAPRRRSRRPSKPTGPIEPGSAPNAVADLVLGRRPDRRPERGRHLRLLQPVVAANEREDDRRRPRSRPASPSTSPPGRSPRSSASASIVVTPGVSTSSGASRRSGKLGRPRHAARDLEVGRVVAVLAGDERVLAGAGRRQEVDRLAAAHHPDSRPAPRRTRARSARRSGGTPRRGAEAPVEPLLVAVERVRVLHDELAHAEEPAPRPRLVALLRLEVVEDLRQLAVRAELARVEGDRLLVRHREDELAAEPVRQLVELRDGVAPALLPELGRRERPA